MSIISPQDLVPAVRSGKLSAVVARLDAAGESVKPTDLGIGLAMASFLGHRDIVRELVRRGALLNLPPGLTDVSALAMAVKGKQNKTTRLLIALGAKIPPGMDTGLTQEELEEAQTLARRRTARKKEAQRTEEVHRTAESHRTEAPPRGNPAVLARPPKPAVLPAASSALSPPTVAASPLPRPPAAQALAPALRPPMPTPVVTPPVKANPPSTPKETLPSLDFTFPTPSMSDAARPTSAPPAAAAPPPAPARMSRGGVVEEIEMVACYGVDTNVLESDLGRWSSGAAEHERSHEAESLNVPELDLNRNNSVRKR